MVPRSRTLPNALRAAETTRTTRQRRISARRARFSVTLVLKKSRAAELQNEDIYDHLYPIVLEGIVTIFPVPSALPPAPHGCFLHFVWRG